MAAEEAQLYLDYVQKTGNQGGSLFLRCRAVQNLRGATPKATILSDDRDGEEKLIAGQSARFLSSYRFIKLSLLYLFGAYEEASEFAELIDRDHDKLAMSIALPEAIFYQALTIAACNQEATAEERQAAHERMAPLAEKLQQWADLCPDNFMARLLLIQAEMARLADEVPRAMTLYDAAIDDATEHQFLPVAAITCERAGDFYLAQDRRRIATAYLGKARDAYRSWHANAKVRHMTQQVPTDIIAPGVDSPTQHGFLGSVGAIRGGFDHPGDPGAIE